MRGLTLEQAENAMQEHLLVEAGQDEDYVMGHITGISRKMATLQQNSGEFLQVPIPDLRFFSAERPEQKEEPSGLSLRSFPKTYGNISKLSNRQARKVVTQMVLDKLLEWEEEDQVNRLISDPSAVLSAFDDPDFPASELGLFNIERDGVLYNVRISKARAGSD